MKVPRYLYPVEDTLPIPYFFTDTELGIKREKKRLGTARKWKTRRRMSKRYCKKTPCSKMGFSQKASCRPWKNCYTRRNKPKYQYKPAE